MTCPHGFDGEQEAAADENEISSCCGTPTTFRDNGYGDWALSCRCCFAWITGSAVIDGIEFLL